MPCAVWREETMRRTTGRGMESLKSPFRFTELPEDIRLPILAYTGLIAPVGLIWDPAKGFSASDPRCYKCSVYWEDRYCCSRHAAFATDCTCWRVPHALFQVSRQMREEVMYLFFSKNHFIISSNPYARKYDALSAFFAWIPPQALGHLRSIEWVLGVYDGDYASNLAAESIDWLNTVEFIRLCTDLSRLSFTLDMFRQFDQYGYGYTYPNNPEGAMWAIYQRITKLMVRLRGLRNLFVHLGWPISMQEEETRLQHEQILERQVMGDDYDSISRGKRRGTPPP